MTTELVELADCPFCGHEAKFNERDFGLVAVLCNARDGGCGAMGGWDEHESEAAKLWNTRALASRAGGLDGWVAVTDRLPEPYQDVEVYPSWDDDTSNTYCPHDGGTNGRKAGNWYHNDREGYDHKINVTHWRPRAKPPAAPEPVGVG